MRTMPTPGSQTQSACRVSPNARGVVVPACPWRWGPRSSIAVAWSLPTLSVASSTCIGDRSSSLRPSLCLCPSPMGCIPRSFVLHLAATSCQRVIDPISSQVLFTRSLSRPGWTLLFHTTFRNAYYGCSNDTELAVPAAATVPLSSTLTTHWWTTDDTATAR